MCDISWLALAPNQTSKKLRRFKKFRMAPSLWWKGTASLQTAERNFHTSFLDYWSAHTFFVHMGLKVEQLVKPARKHERFIEDLGDDIRLTLGFGFYLRPSYCFLADMQSTVSGLASLLSDHEAVWRGHCSVRGREFRSPFFSRFVMVPRLLAPARAMRSRTCADVFQPCHNG